MSPARSAFDAGETLNRDLLGEPTGLYGWVRGNDARSLQFFGLFAVSVQLLAALVLFLPLTLLDEAHAPLFAPAGYLTRYVPLIFAGSVAVFAAQLFWYGETVKKRSGFRYIDARDEPRLCAIIEPLIKRSGMAPPFVAVIESAACNAFACGISRNHAVAVVTRGLIEATSDAELAAVLAHELAHIRGGDIRMMAAANICMANLQALEKANVLQFRSWVRGVWCLAFPVFFPLMLFGGLVAQVAMRAAWRARFTIIASREFIADAAAAELTRDPAALARVLTRIRGRAALAGLGPQDDAMMIAGRSEGADATHPTIEQRIAALARVTGPLVFNAPGAPSGKDMAGIEADALFATRRTPTTAPLNHHVTDLFGMTRPSRIAFAATVAVFLAIHAPELGDGEAMARKFDIRPLGQTLGLDGLSCSTGAVPCGPLMTLSRPETPATQLRPYTGQSGRLVGARAEMSADGRFAWPHGRFGDTAPEKLALAEIEQVGCIPKFVPVPVGVGPLLPVTERSRSLDQLVRDAEVMTIAHGLRGTEERRDWLRGYPQRRAAVMQAAVDEWGEEGLAALQEALATPLHEGVVAQLRQEAARPAFANAGSAVERAILRALLRKPAAFVPCSSLHEKFGSQ